MKRSVISAVAIVTVAMSSGCTFDSGDDGRGRTHAPGAVYTTIDADHTLSTQLGEGAGLFVEYTSGGIWRLWTSCDTNATGRGCAYDVHLSSQSPIDGVAMIDTEGNDYVEERPRSVSFYADTYNGSDAIEIRTEPGALVTVELVLDGYVAPEFFVWYGNERVHNGANGSPVVFQPDLP